MRHFSAKVKKKIKKIPPILKPGVQEKRGSEAI